MSKKKRLLLIFWGIVWAVYFIPFYVISHGRIAEALYCSGAIALVQFGSRLLFARTKKG